MMPEIREKSYFPSIATYVRNWIRECEICTQDKRMKNTRITPELFHIPEWDLAPEDLIKLIYYQNYRQVDVTRTSSQQLE